MRRFQIWMLTGILLLGISGCQRSRDSSKDSPAQIAAGKAVFQENCVRCHGADGRKIADWRKEVNKMTDDQIKNQIRNGSGGMPPFKDKLSAEQVDAVAAYAKHLASS